MAIQGSTGYFQLQMPDGRIGYTRDGNFSAFVGQGPLVNSNGYQLQPQIQLPQGTEKITIGPDGTVSATLPGQADQSEVGKITLASFANPAGLQATGSNSSDRDPSQRVNRRSAPPV